MSGGGMSQKSAGRYRRMYSKIWTSRKFEELSPAEKLVTAYLLTGPQTNRVGYFQFSPWSVGAVLRGLPEASEPRTCLETVCRTGGWEWDRGHGVVWIPTWWEYNMPGTANNLQGVLKDVRDVTWSPLLVRFRAMTAALECWEERCWPANVRCDELVDGQVDQDGVAVQATARDLADVRDCAAESLAPSIPPPGPPPVVPKKARAPRASRYAPDYSDEFEQFFEQWPAHKRKNKAEAYQAWKDVAAVRPEIETLLATVQRQGMDPDWLRENGQFVPYPASWLHKHGWANGTPTDRPSVSSRTLTTLQAPVSPALLQLERQLRGEPPALSEHQAPSLLEDNAALIEEL